MCCAGFRMNGLGLRVLNYSKSGTNMNNPTPSELLIENRQLRNQVADLEALHADAIENWKDEMEEVAHLKADLEKQIATTNEYVNWAESLQDRVKELETALRDVALDLNNMWDAVDLGEVIPNPKSSLDAARAVLDNRREG